MLAFTYLLLFNMFYTENDKMKFSAVVVPGSATGIIVCSYLLTVRQLSMTG